MTPTKESLIMMKHYLKDEAVTALDGTTRIIPAGSTVRVYIEQPDDSPTQPQWAEGGLPPVGIECEFYNGNSEAWEHCTVVAHHDGGAVAAVHEDDLSYSYHWGAGSDFRPIRTQAEIERDAVIEQAERLVESKTMDVVSSKHLSVLYDAGWLRKPCGRWNFMQKVRDAAEKECGVTLSVQTLHSIADAFDYER